MGYLFFGCKAWGEELAPVTALVRGVGMVITLFRILIQKMRTNVERVRALRNDADVNVQRSCAGCVGAVWTALDDRRAGECPLSDAVDRVQTRAIPQYSSHSQPSKICFV